MTQVTRENRAQALFEGQPDWLGHTLTHAFRFTEVSPDRVSVELSDGSALERLACGVLRLTARHPTDQAPPLILSAGIHGNETAPIELLNALVTDLLDGRLRPGTDALFILGNPPAMLTGNRFLQFNLNRLFNNAHQKPEHAGREEALRAQLIEQACQVFLDALQPEERSATLHYDLHTAIRPSRRERFALYPFVPQRQLPDAQQAFLRASAIHTLLLQHRRATTFSAFTSETLGLESFTLELGKVHPFGQNDLNRLRHLDHTLRTLLSGQPTPPAATGKDLTIFEVVHEIIHTGRDFRLHIPDTAANFTEFSPGTVIWEAGEESYRVGDQPEAVVFPNPHVPPGQRAGLMIRARAGSHTPPPDPESRQARPERGGFLQATEDQPDPPPSAGPGSAPLPR